MRALWLALLMFTLSFVCGCISVDCGYAPNDDIKAYAFSGTLRYPVTYSVNIEYSRDDFFFDPDYDDFAEEIKEKLVQTGLFSEVSHAYTPPKDGYHFAFNFHVAGASIEKSGEAGVVAGYSLFTIPVWEESTLDGAVTIYLQGEPIYAVGAAELLRHYVWLPLAPFGLIWNGATGWWMAEKGVINGLINGAATFHYDNYCRE